MNCNLEEKVQILYCDTTASNTGRINSACVLLEQKISREMLVFACSHHVYELVLKGVFEVKISQVTGEAVSNGLQALHLKNLLLPVV